MALRYTILKDGFNEDGSYSLFLEQEFESKESGRVWQTPIMMIYSTKPDNYEEMSDEYKLETTKEEHDTVNSVRITDHASKISILTAGTNAQKKDIIKALLLEHRTALKLAGHIDDKNKSKHKNMTHEEIAQEMEARKMARKANDKARDYKTIAE